MNKNLALTFTLGACAASFTATAGEQQHCEQTQQSEQQQSNYQYCDNQIKWYIGGAIGRAETHIDQNRISQYFSQNSLDINRLSIDEKDTGYNAFVGYQFNSNLALEAGYLDFGQRAVRFAGQTTNIGAYYDAAENIYPQSADGLLINLVASWPFAENWKLSGKVGYYDWEGDYVTFDAQGSQGSDSISDSDMLLGGELNYRLGEQTQLFVGYQRVKLNRDTNDMWSLGLRYYFNDAPQHKAKPTPPPTSPPTLAKPAKPAKPVDSDKDGVFDNRDACPNSDRAYKVDDKGCTIETEQWVDFSLVINYARNSAEIDAKYNGKINALAEFINRYKVKTLTVYGHTSATGSASYNMKLSKQRAKSVAQKLSQAFGIEASIIQAVGKGETELKVEGDSAYAHEQNRRIELSIKERLVVPVRR